MEGKKTAHTLYTSRYAEMLNRRESEVMGAVYSLCSEKGICLISPAELLVMLPQSKKYTEEQLESILSELALDNYFELLSSERRGEKTYVISLRANGYAFKRCSVQQRRDFAVKLGWAITSAVIAFLVGWVLKWIF
ncbi:MAG: hypothetical protein IJX96_05180 [Clostridia bacterium]|nr:hypothetical protein [Clostridia bacterium]